MATRLTLTQYHEMIRQGKFTPGERVELIAGQLHPMPPKGTRHAVCCTQLLRLLIPLLPAGLLLRCQDPITLPGDNEPEPDIAIVKHDVYLQRHPTPAEILLVIEIADTLLEYDRSIKAPLYAQAGIPTYWLVNLVDNQLEVFSQPIPSGYQQKTIYNRTQVVPFFTTLIACADFLPSSELG
ncbi:MAG: Uma2 family endonuclease [Gloeomargarita sp. SKYBB_i_bin120]|nr:Uma2 family endonuclease [Gloeomargarita sp. SKYB120]MDW8177751.1 Uma2 family endonuclease [Gloeomargarita sp. SKYBB_i_bin120]